MAYILDTNHCIYLMNGWGNDLEKLHPEEYNTINQFNKIKNHVVYMSEASIGEILYGIARSKKREYNQRRLQLLLLAIPPISVSRNVWQIYGETKAELSNMGKRIPDMDLLIASTAKLYKMTLVTNDKHMKNLPNSFTITNWATSK